MDERSSEIAIAKLRGLRLRSTTAYALSETALLLTAALPFGLLLGWAVDVVLTRHLLADGHSRSRSRRRSGSPCVVAWLGGAVAAYGATRRTLRAPVLEQMRTVLGQTGQARTVDRRRDDGRRARRGRRLRAAPGRFGHHRAADPRGARARRRPALGPGAPAGSREAAWRGPGAPAAWRRSSPCDPSPGDRRGCASSRCSSWRSVWPPLPSTPGPWPARRVRRRPTSRWGHRPSHNVTASSPCGPPGGGPHRSIRRGPGRWPRSSRTPGSSPSTRPDCRP